MCSGLCWARVRSQLKWGARTATDWVLSARCSSFPPYTTITITTTTTHHPTIPIHRPSHQSPALITPQISDHIRLQYFSVKQRRGDQWCDVIFICVTARAVSVLQFPIKVTGKSSTSPDFYCGFIIVLLRVKPR